MDKVTSLLAQSVRVYPETLYHILAAGGPLATEAIM